MIHFSAVGMLQDDDKTILKPYYTEYEIDFYEIVQNAKEDDLILQELKTYIPAFYGRDSKLISGEGEFSSSNT